ncbi:MAG: glycosyltransferase family 4 protein [Nitrosospira sp.]
MKIALYVHCFFPTHYHGTETYTLALAKNLQTMGHEPVVVSSIFEGEKKADRLITRYSYLGIPVYCIDKNYIPHSSLMEQYYQPEMRKIHTDLLQELQPDIVHVTHLLNHTAALLEAAQNLAIPTVATFTDFFGFCMNLKLETADGSLCAGPNSQRTNCFTCCAKAGVKQANPTLSEQRLTKLVPLIRLGCTLFNSFHRLPILRRSQLSLQLRDIKARPDVLGERYSLYRAVIAPTRFLQSAYERNGLTGAPIHKIHFGVDLDRKPKQIRSLSAPIRFGFIGQIAPHKGTALLVEAFCRLPLNQSELHIYGSEDQHPSYTQTIKQRCINFPVFFRGTFSSEKMRSVLDEMDFLVIPSTWYENSPLVLLNALASHTPVIVSDVEGLTEFLEPDVNGFTFARGSIDDLERVMRQVIETRERSRELSLVTNYPKTSMAMTEEVVSIYYSILKKEPA